MYTPKKYERLITKKYANMHRNTGLQFQRWRPAILGGEGVEVLLAAVYLQFGVGLAGHSLTMLHESAAVLGQLAPLSFSLNTETAHLTNWPAYLGYIALKES